MKSAARLVWCFFFAFQVVADANSSSGQFIITPQTVTVSNAELESRIVPPQSQSGTKPSGSSAGTTSITPDSSPIVKTHEVRDWTDVDFATVESAANDGDATAQFEMEIVTILGRRVPTGTTRRPKLGIAKQQL